jgi:hypothetical protein
MFAISVICPRVLREEQALVAVADSEEAVVVAGKVEAKVASVPTAISGAMGEPAGLAVMAVWVAMAV